MTDYRLVPVEPTLEMVEAAESAYMPFGDMELALRMAILTAPAVQGEPIGFCEDTALSLAERTFSSEVDEQLAEDVIQYARSLHTLYTAPQPAEQQPALTKYQPCGCVICTCEHETQCQGCGAKHCGTHPVGQIPGPVYQQPAERQPAPDVAKLQRTLEASFRREEQLEAEVRELKREKFKKFRGEECWMWAGDGSDRLETLTCPVVIAPADLMAIINRGSPSPDVTALAEALERSVAGFDALSGMVSLDAGARNYARQKAIELNGSLAAYRQKGGEA